MKYIDDGEYRLEFSDRVGSLNKYLEVRCGNQVVEVETLVPRDTDPQILAKLLRGSAVLLKESEYPQSVINNFSYMTPAWVRADHIQAQPFPKGDGEVVYSEVIKDLALRSLEGRAQYGTFLKTNNGRDALLDAYQELLDLLVYIKQELMERDTGDFVTEVKKLAVYLDELGQNYARHTGEYKAYQRSALGIIEVLKKFDYYA